jgi:hypothetical protein
MRSIVPAQMSAGTRCALCPPYNHEFRFTSRVERPATVTPQGRDAAASAAEPLLT